MREISFRGFHPDKDGDTAIFIDGKKTKGGWYYGKLLEDHVSDIYAIVYYVNLAGNIYDLSEITIVNVIPETVGQFTGLTDKNGVKIFEGDILEVYFIDKAIKNEKKIDVKNTRTVLVEWSNDSFCTKELYRNYRLDSKLEIITEVIYDYKGTAKGVPKNGDYYFTEVIGNIYENPELMKGGEANV